MNAPTPEQIRAARLARGLSQTAAAALIGKSLGAWQKWEAPTSSDQHRQMDAAYWELFQIRAHEEFEAAGARLNGWTEHDYQTNAKGEYTFTEVRQAYIMWQSAVSRQK